LNDLQRARLWGAVHSVVGGQRGLNDLQRARLWGAECTVLLAVKED
jgi:hypothetical protein